MNFPARRLTLRRAGEILILDDCYNANPESMTAALQTLAELQVGRRLGVLGDMRELGTATRGAHQELGRQAGQVLDHLFAIGEEAAVVAEAAVAAGMPSSAVTVVQDRVALARAVVARARAG